MVGWLSERACTAGLWWIDFTLRMDFSLLSLGAVLILGVTTGLLLLLTGLAAAFGRSPQVTTYLAVQFAPYSSEQSQHYELSSDRVIDGTTLLVTDDQQEIEVGLCGITALEAEASKAHLLQLLSRSVDSRIILVAVESELSVLVAEAFRPTDSAEPELELHLNTQMLLDGMAAVDADSVDSCPNGSLYRAAEAKAKQSHLSSLK